MLQADPEQKINSAREVQKEAAKDKKKIKAQFSSPSLKHEIDNADERRSK